MAARGRRSRGCVTCRKRHIKCDATRPRCRRCGEDGVRCEGYSAPEFISYSADDLQSTRSSTPDSSPSEQQLQVRHRLGPLHDSVRPRLDSTAVVGHLGHALSDDSITAKAQNQRWTGLSVHMSPGTLSWKCLQALSQTFYGEARKDVFVVRKGRQLYISCIQTVGNRLADATLRNKNDTLQAVMTLGCYEALCATRESGWLHHSRGMEMILKMRGPAAAVDPEFFELFRGCRFLCLCSALMMHTGTALASEEWKTTPWLLQDKPKLFIDLLMDHLADMVDIRSKFMAETEERSLTARRTLQVLRELGDWERAWILSPDALRVEMPPTIDDPLPGPRKLAYRFTDLYGANVWGMYHAIVCCAVETTLLAADAGQLQPGEASTLFFKGQSAAYDICRSIEYHLDFNCGSSMGEVIMLWPLREAWNMLGKGNTEDGQWLERRLYATMKRPAWAKINGHLLENNWDRVASTSMADQT